MRTQRILLLEDDSGVSESMSVGLFPHKVDPVDNLTSFNFLLYKLPGVKSYDLVLMDLYFRIPSRVLEKFCARVPEMPKEPCCKVHNIALFGLDYFVSKVLTHPDTGDIAKDKFVLFSGHTRLIRAEKLFEKHDIQFPHDRLLDKADDHFYDKLNGFIKMPD